MARRHRRHARAAAMRRSGTVAQGRWAQRYSSATPEKLLRKTGP